MGAEFLNNAIDDAGLHEAAILWHKTIMSMVHYQQQDFDTGHTLAPMIGGRLKEARLAAGLTQAELAEVAGVEQSTLAHWERGKTKPGPDKVALMAPRLRVAEEWLLYGRGRGPAPVKRHLGLAEDSPRYETADRDRRDTADAMALRRPIADRLGLKDLTPEQEAELLEDIRAIVKRHRPR